MTAKKAPPSVPVGEADAKLLRSARRLVQFIELRAPRQYVMREVALLVRIVLTGS